MQDHTITLIVANGGIAATLIAAISSQMIARKSLRTQWVADNRKQECRELLTALSAASIALKYWLEGIDRHAFGDPSRRFDNTATEKYDQANTLVEKTIGDRLFIAADIRQYDIAAKWRLLVILQSQKLDDIKQKADFDKIRDTIVQIGLKEQGGFLKQWWWKMHRPKLTV